MLKAKEKWQELLEGKGLASLSKLLPSWLLQRRWFAGKAKTIQSVSISDVIPLSSDDVDSQVNLLVLLVEYADEKPDTYLMPLGYATGQLAKLLIGDNSPSLIATVKMKVDNEAKSGVLYDTFGEDAPGQMLLDLIGSRRRVQGQVGTLVGSPLQDFKRLRGSNDEHLPVRNLRVEQSNSAIVFGEKLLLKMFRRMDQGVNPDLEIGRFLTESGRFDCTPPVAGSLDYVDPTGQVSTVGILQSYVSNEGDAWSYTLENVKRFFEQVVTTKRSMPFSPDHMPQGGLFDASACGLSPLALDLCDVYVESALRLGQRTAEMHLALASAPENPDFAPESFSELYQRSVYQGMRGLVQKTLSLLENKLNDLPENIQDDAKHLVHSSKKLLHRLHGIVGRKLSGSRIRCHGDYHLGQVLFTGKDFVIIDFEGEPSRRLSERRIKRSPLRDVAGMIRSFEYASQTVLHNQVESMVKPDEMPEMQKWANFWSQSISTQFLGSYLKTISEAEFATKQREETSMLLDVFLLEKAVYELAYELNNRPTWVHVPLRGILGLLES